MKLIELRESMDQILASQGSESRISFKEFDEQQPEVDVGVLEVQGVGNVKKAGAAKAVSVFLVSLGLRVEQGGPPPCSARTQLAAIRGVPLASTAWHLHAACVGGSGIDDAADRTRHLAAHRMRNLVRCRCRSIVCAQRSTRQRSANVRIEPAAQLEGASPLCDGGPR